MRILVCGATGFIGAHLAHSLVREGHEVVGADIAPNTSLPAALHLAPE